MPVLRFMAQEANWMWDDNTTLCFETKAFARVFLALYPSYPKNKCVSLEDLVDQCLGEIGLSSEERLPAFQELLEEDQKPRALALLSTIERLREALILTDDDADFCFSELAETPKNQELLEVFHRYLDSPLAWDWTARAWAFIEKLKAFETVLPFTGKISCVRVSGAPFLFSELAKAFTFSAGIDEVRIQESWEISPTETRSRGILAKGSAEHLLEHMGARIERLLSRGISPINVCVPFHGTAPQEKFLQYWLDHRKIPWQSFLLSEPVPKVQSERHFKWIEAIRQDFQKPLIDRLRLAQFLMNDEVGRRSDTNWDIYLDRLQALQKISEPDRQYLANLTLPTSSVAAPANNSDGVLLLPFHPMPLSTAHHLLAFVDKDFLRPQKSTLLFSHDEIDRLNERGFSVNSTRQMRARQNTFFKLISQSDGILFSSFLPPVLDSRTRLITLKKERKTTVVPERSFDVQTPTKSLSATQLETYARCPSQYFFSHKLRLRRPVLGQQEGFALLFGQGVHLALEHFFKEGGLSQLSGPHDLESHLIDRFQRALKELAPTLQSEHPYFTILVENFRPMTSKVRKLEKQLETLFGKSRVLECEKPFELHVEGTRIRGKIDRVDETEMGSVLILDYKTGNVDFSPGHIAEGSHFQALVYLLAAEQLYPRQSGLLFYDLKRNEIRRGIVFDDEIKKDERKGLTRGHVFSREAYAELRQQGLTHLTQIAESITFGNFPPHPSNTVCAYCDYAALCRSAYGFQ